MKDLLVVMGNSTGELRGTMDQYHQQLESAGIDYHVEPLVIDDSWATIGWKIRKIREVLSEHGDHEFIVFTDAFDVQFFGTKERVLRKIPRHGILIAAEKNCHPPECLTLDIPDAGPWKFANGGCLAGTPENILTWCSAIESHPLYQSEKIDQGFFNELLAEGSNLAPIDWRTELFFCLYGGYDELDFVDGIPMNTLYGTQPSFLHANGGWSTGLMKERMK